jgi:hypothetical protein
MQKPPNIVTVLSSTHNAVDVIFRKILEHNTCQGTILVLALASFKDKILLRFLNKKLSNQNKFRRIIHQPRNVWHI